MDWIPRLDHWIHQNCYNASFGIYYGRRLFIQAYTIPTEIVVIVFIQLPCSLYLHQLLIEL